MCQCVNVPMRQCANAEYYESNVRLLSDCCTLCFILGIGSMIGVLTLIFVAQYYDDDTDVLVTCVFAALTGSLTIAGILAFLLDWKSGKLPVFGRHPSKREDEGAFTFQPEDIRKKAMTLYEEIRDGARRHRGSRGVGTRGPEGLSVGTSENSLEDKIKFEEVFEHFKKATTRKAPTATAQGMDANEIAKEINKHRQEQQVCTLCCCRYE